MTERGKLIHALDNIEHDLQHLGYLRKEATQQDLPIIVAEQRAQLAAAAGSVPPPPAPPWYTENEMRHWLTCKKYSAEIASELAKDYATNLQNAFAKGWAMAQNAQVERRAPSTFAPTPGSALCPICKENPQPADRSTCHECEQELDANQECED